VSQVPHANEHSRRVFISSASGEALSEYRQAAVQVCQRLKMEPVYMEDWRPQRAAPLEVCRDRVADCDVFVLLLAHRYGSRPADGSASYTELEYEAAKAQSGMEILAFVLDKRPEWPRNEIDMGPDAAALDSFKARVKRAHTVKPLGDVASFRENLILALSGPGPSVTPVSIPRPDRLSRETHAEPASAPPRPPTMHAVPPYVGTVTFIGRDDDLARLDEWGRSGDPVMLVEAIGGMGKSALAWEWVNYRAADTIDALEGTLWWSFYDRPASMAKVFRELLRCMSGRPMEEIERLDGTGLSDEVLQWLRRRRFLVVLDGYERLLTDPDADEFVRSLASAAPSKILITTRLKPLPLWGRSAKPIPGVQHYRLPGLTNDDMKALLGKLDVAASDHAIASFLRPLDNHPLLAGLVAGEVHEYRESPGDLDRWLADPRAGGDFRLSRLPLAKRRTHILATSFAKLGREPRRLLETMAGLQAPIHWDTLVAVNPFLPPDLTPGPEARQHAQEQIARAKARLDDALKILEQCGLLSWDRATNTYDLHAITRAYVAEQADDTSGVVMSSRVPDHFQALSRAVPSRPVSPKEMGLTRTIALFREYLNAKHWAEASQLWATFGDPLLADFGDYRKVVQLLEPLTSKGSPAARADLALAYFHLGWYDDAIRLNVEILEEVLGDEHAIGIENTLSRLGSAYLATGEVVKSERCEALRACIEATYDSPASGSSALKRAVHALARGRTDEARDLFIEARRLGPELNTPWFADSLTVEWLRLSFFTKEPLTLDEINAAAGQVQSEAYRRRLEELRCLMLIRKGRHGQALEAIREHDRLARKAGIEVIPAREAFLLASLGRHAEARAAIEDTLELLKKIRDNPITTLERRLSRFRRSGSAMQALYYLARAYRTLDMPHNALKHATTAYRLAWADGSPNHFHWDLTAARHLLEDMGAPLPELRSVDPDSVKIPMEDKIRSLIGKFAAKGQPQ
jgi:tetratricopeptide (TPR) repeat protein